MWASWLSSGLLILGALLGSLGAHLQFNPLLAVAGIALLAGMVISGLTECRLGR
ncbi:histidine kinase [Serratia inhibens]|uniref:histidine kinase n=1 Tax=Serratia inhibens TaxID=2338073 RepID=UPI003C7C0BC5